VLSTQVGLLPSEILIRYGDSWVESMPSAARFFFDVSVVGKGMPVQSDPHSKSGSQSGGTLADRIRAKHRNWGEDMR